MKIYNSGVPFERIQMDILGPFPKSILGNIYLLVITDHFTKWVETCPLINFRTKTVVNVFVSQVISRYGVPLEILTDQGRNFDSKLVESLSMQEWHCVALIHIKRISVLGNALLIYLKIYIIYVCMVCSHR